jgi:hypothetical protein
MIWLNFRSSSVGQKHAIMQHIAIYDRPKTRVLYFGYPSRVWTCHMCMFGVDLWKKRISSCHPVGIDQLAAYVDAEHADCSKTHRSLGAEVFCLAGAVIYHRAKWIIVICTSSTEAEFVACVRAGKSVRYLWSILNELGLQQRSATLIMWITWPLS